MKYTSMWLIELGTILPHRRSARNQSKLLQKNLHRTRCHPAHQAQMSLGRTSCQPDQPAQISLGRNYCQPAQPAQISLGRTCCQPAQPARIPLGRASWRQADPTHSLGRTICRQKSSHPTQTRRQGHTRLRSTILHRARSLHIPQIPKPRI